MYFTCGNNLSGLGLKGIPPRVSLVCYTAFWVNDDNGKRKLKKVPLKQQLKSVGIVTVS